MAGSGAEFTMDMICSWHLPFSLVLLFTQLAPALGGKCPEGCFCSNSIFCTQRQSSSVPQDLPATTKHLYLFRNGIEALSPKEFSGLTQLVMLDLSQNKLSELPDEAFKPLASLRNLDLSSNQITHITQDSFSGLVLLERLYLYGNRIQSIHPAAFQDLEQLLELKLQENLLTSVPELRLPMLLLLDLSFNHIPLGDTHLNTPHLESLKLAGMGLSSLDKEFLGGLTNLRELDLSKNQLSTVPQAVSAAQDLTRLSLASNPLTQLLREDLQKLNALKELDVSGLKLQGFPEGFPELFPHLVQLTAAENPFNCVCSLSWLPGWLKAQDVTLKHPEETRCHFPPRNAGKELHQLEHTDFGCPVTTPAAPITSSTSEVLPSTSPPVTMPAIPLANLTNGPFTEKDNKPLSSAETSSSKDMVEATDKPLCSDGDICRVDQQSSLECDCPPGALGPCCMNEEAPLAPEETTANPEPDIVPREVTATTIQLDLQRYVAIRPYIRGVRITYRNLSGPDRRPVQLNFPTSYVKYTLRGLRPNSTYSICVSPHGEPSEGDARSCTEASTSGAPQSVLSEQQAEKGHLTTVLGATLAALLVLLLVAVIAGTICHLQRRRGKGQGDPDLGEALPLELGGVKACVDNGELLQKQPENSASLGLSIGDYEGPLSLGQCPGSNNTATLKPSYF
ncbi:vasorin-like isoform X1 [Brienomyrus brachyistius]|uniref:vasorin-like isoform X1 n=2 Tax=Brienomyrus brachyistius TaxID=42636 RepID=UPI0020B34B71|nr:vasorin-like isoform X1 [Brienomyrus brachyistius]